MNQVLDSWWNSLGAHLQALHILCQGFDVVLLDRHVLSLYHGLQRVLKCSLLLIDRIHKLLEQKLHVLGNKVREQLRLWHRIVYSCWRFPCNRHISFLDLRKFVLVPLLLLVDVRILLCRVIKLVDNALLQLLYLYLFLLGKDLHPVLVVGDVLQNRHCFSLIAEL